MRIEVWKSDTFTMGGGWLYLYRDVMCLPITRGGLGKNLGGARLDDEYDIDHSLAFELMKCMGHDPVYVDEAVASPDPNAEWRQAVTRMAKQLAKSAGANRDLWNEAANVVAIGEAIEAAERAKAKENQK